MVTVCYWISLVYYEPTVRLVRNLLNDSTVPGRWVHAVGVGSTTAEACVELHGRAEGFEGL